jgi:hypothetical protein
MLVASNRAPVLTLWAAVVAEWLGFDNDEALSLDRAVTGLNAYAKSKALACSRPSSESVGNPAFCPRMMPPSIQ